MREQGIVARSFELCDRFASGNWGGLSVVDDKVFFGLCKHKIDQNADLYILNLTDDTLEKIEEFSDVFSLDAGYVSNGKIHTPFHQLGSQVYFGTHLGYYKKELNGFLPYRGGHLISYNLETRTLIDLGIPCPGEGIISMEVDQKRSFIYIMTWPSAKMLEYNIITREWAQIGQYQVANADSACRSIVCVKDGKLFFSLADGRINYWDPIARAVSTLEENILDIVDNVSSELDWKAERESQGSGGVVGSQTKSKRNNNFAHMWHPAIYDPKDDCVLATIHFASALIRISPETKKAEFLAQLSINDEQGLLPTSGTPLTLCWGENRKLYSFGFNPSYHEGKKKININLIGYDIDAGIYKDYGGIKIEDGRNVIYSNTLGATNDGRLVALAWVELLEEDKGEFFASNPAKVDVGIEAKDNPYEIRLILFRQPK